MICFAITTVLIRNPPSEHCAGWEHRWRRLDTQVGWSTITVRDGRFSQCPGILIKIPRLFKCMKLIDKPDGESLKRQRGPGHGTGMGQDRGHVVDVVWMLLMLQQPHGPGWLAHFLDRKLPGVMRCCKPVVFMLRFNLDRIRRRLKPIHHILQDASSSEIEGSNSSPSKE
jgi:hypothetical protein